MLKSPFSTHLLQEELLAHHVPPKFNLYDKIGDPMEHIYHFRQLMILVDDKERIIVQGFSNYPAGSITWFHQLPPYSISDFAQLCDQFVRQYACKAQPHNRVLTIYLIEISHLRTLKKVHPLICNKNGIRGEYVGIEFLKVRHDVTNLGLTIHLLPFWCIEIDLNIQPISFTLYLTQVHQELHIRYRIHVATNLHQQ